MREITSHRVEGDTNDGLKIEVRDEPGPGGANHAYFITGMDFRKNDAWNDVGDAQVPEHARCEIVFQCGGIPENGVNGMTHEALLAIVIDRLERFQDGPFASQYNATALQNAREALRALQKRTLDRIKRGVEGQEVA